MSPHPAWRRPANRTGLSVVDGLVALGLCGLGVIELAFTTSRFANGPLALVLTMASTLPLAWRRRAPLVTSTVVALAVGAQGLLQQKSPGATYFAGLLATYTVAAHCPHALARVTGLSLMVAAFTTHVTDILPGPIEPSDVLFTYVPLLGAWGWGELQRRRQARAATLESRSLALEREADERAARAAAEERARIARELHDVVAHSMSVLVLQAGAARRIAEVDPPRAREALATIETVGRQALAEMRLLLDVMRVPATAEPDVQALAPQPSFEQLDGLLAQVRAAGLPVTLRVEGSPRALPPGVDLSAYRIVQEALTNTLKHTDGATAEVVVHYASCAVELEISDRGGSIQPHPPSPNGGGHGLIGMRERVALFGGQLHAGPDAGGFRVRASLPFESP